MALWEQLLARFSSPPSTTTVVFAAFLAGGVTFTVALGGDGCCRGSSSTSTRERRSPDTMRCAVYDHRSPAGVRMSECPRPSPLSRRPGTVLCAVRAASVNPVDAKYIVGDKLGVSLMPRVARLVSGVVPGFDFSGVVLDAPDGSGWEPGDEVFGLADDPAKVAAGKFRGSFAELVEAPLDQIARKPRGLSHAEAAALPLVGVTALQLFERHGLRKGQRVLIIGASGGVGHVAVQVAARGIGANVTAVCSRKNAGWVRGECGARTVIEYDGGEGNGEDVFDRLAAAAAVEGPFDLVLDCVHSADPRDLTSSYHQRIALQNDPPILSPCHFRENNNYIVLGGKTRHWLMAGLKRVTGVDLFSCFELFWIRMPGSALDLERLAKLAGDGRIRPKLALVVPFNEEGVREAFKLLRSRRTAGKAMLVMEDKGKDESD